MSTMADQRVNVAVRIRPVIQKGGSAMHQQERFEPLAARRIGDTGVQMQEQKQDDSGNRSSTFQFDFVFDHDSTQLEVYEDSVVDLIDAALVGRNATILAYGQTGSGKTHTMLGDVRPNPLENDLLTNESGVFLRVLADLIEYKQRRAATTHVVIGLSCVEIYNEKIRDLLSPADTPPQIRPVMTDDHVYLPALISKEVTTLNSVFTEVQLAIKRRQSRATDSNAASSRSHCIFMIDVLQQAATAPPPSLSLVMDQPRASPQSRASPQPRSSRTASPTPDLSKQSQNEGWCGTILRVPGQEEPVYASKILLADLAGSEKIQKSGVTGDAMQEATAINSSLTALGNVVHSLHEGSLASYRTSNLTRLLRPGFSQTSGRVLLLAQVAPTQLTFDESVSTMHFANKVKAMKVQTTRGVEGDRLQFDYFDVAKQRDELAGDLRIWATEYEAHLCLRHAGLSLRDKRFCSIPNAGKLRSKPMRDHANDVRDRGAIPIAEKSKHVFAQARVDREAAEKKQLIEERRLYATDMVEKHDAKMKDAASKYAEEDRAKQSHGLQFVEMEQTLRREEMKETQRSAWDALELSCVETMAKHQRAIVAVVKKELKALQAVKMPDLNAACRDLLDGQKSDDVAYAQDCARHCNGRRFGNHLLGLRKMQAAFFTMRCNALLLESWAKAHAPKQERQQVHQQR